MSGFEVKGGAVYRMRELPIDTQIAPEVSGTISLKSLQDAVPILTVRQVIGLLAPHLHSEICLTYDALDGIWTAYPGGGIWTDVGDELPIITGSDPVAVVAELLEAPAVYLARRSQSATHKGEK